MLHPPSLRARSAPIVLACVLAVTVFAFSGAPWPGLAAAAPATAATPTAPATLARA